ncbi:hypothetical protein TIFTF001_017281 [Ficus carica]|uniref:Uncharacterized protein n=1 Tax=Ficus carica TaxID=3494 RepID=A0AA88A8X9_FICCA|nr:hypothetical protein TIFTF001_017281 [Ficus carica]
MQDTRWERVLGAGSKPHLTILKGISQCLQPRGSNLASVHTREHPSSKRSTNANTTSNWFQFLKEHVLDSTLDARATTTTKRSRSSRDDEHRSNDAQYNVRENKDTISANGAAVHLTATQGHNFNYRVQ